MIGTKFFVPVAAVCLVLGAIRPWHRWIRVFKAEQHAPVGHYPASQPTKEISSTSVSRTSRRRRASATDSGHASTSTVVAAATASRPSAAPRPRRNPQFGIATAFGARNTVPSFITLNGPIREARFKRLPNGQPDGGVHALYVISQRNDGTGNAGGCNIAQDNFAQAVSQNNVIFRIPTPVFGTGLIEAITESELNRNLTEGAAGRQALGITGRLNHNGNDGRVTRFGWKAQNVSAACVLGRGLQRRDGHHQRSVPGGARRGAVVPVRHAAE